MKRTFFVLSATLIGFLIGGGPSWAQGEPVAPIVSPSMIPVPEDYMSPTAFGIPISYAPEGGEGGGGGGGCGVGSCCATGGCGSPGCSQCCESGYTNRFSIFGEFLYLRARDVEVAWAEPIDGPIVAPGPAFPIQIGRVATADMDNQPGFRVGFSYNPDCCTSITGTYTQWEGSTNDTIGTGAPNVIRSLVSHPGTATAAQNFLLGRAQYNMSLDLVDLDLHTLVEYCSDYQFGYVMGVRWGQTEQTFQANFAGTGTESVFTDLDFYGVGVKAGLEGERWIGRQLSVHAKLLGSLIPGEFRADYRQSQSFDPTVVTASWKAGRIVPVVDLEFGTSWTNQCDTWKVTAGYMYSAWFNSVQTDEWIQAVRTSNFVGLSDTMTFDGLVARVEAKF